jgi:hypothetical protein
MISAKLIELIELHAIRIAADVADDLATNARTPGFRAVKREDLEQRVFTLVHSLGNWISTPQSQAVRDEFGEWGAKRFGQGIPLSEVVYAVIVLKSHLRRYIREHGLMDAAFPRVEADYILPMHLHSLQELNGQVSDFFDEALYALALGYERSRVLTTTSK